MIEAVKTRLAARIPALDGRLRGAAEMAHAMASGTLPGGDLFGYVSPSGFTGGQPSSATARFVQPLETRVTVTLGFRTRSATAEAALEEVDDTLRAVMGALCGWTPDAQTPGVFQVESGLPAAFEKGVFLFELNFTITDSLRITP